jgi:formamidopyrimidine-DNA glycosylase
LKGQRVLRLTRRAKYLLAALGSTETLLMHLGMSGSFRVEMRPRSVRRLASVAARHDHVVFSMDSHAVIHFNDPRRFGYMDLLTPRQLAGHPVLSRLGPEPLSEEFDAAALARACARRSAPLKVVLLDQRVVAGLGNIYASEALHVAGLAPHRRASSIATPGGAPRPAAHRLIRAIKQVLLSAIERTSSRRYRSSRFRVYDREAERCLRIGCGGTIRRRSQAGRSTFYCPVCQR